jgi:hypothetical protein
MGKIPNRFDEKSLSANFNPIFLPEHSKKPYLRHSTLKRNWKEIISFIREFTFK